MTSDASFSSLLEHLARAQAASRASQEMQTGVPEGAVEGQDPSGVVTARLDAAGRLVSLHVAEDWRSRLADADALRGALLGAAGAAQARRFGFDPMPVAEAGDGLPASIDDINRVLDEAAERAVEVTEADRRAVQAQVAEVVDEIKHAVATKTLAEAHEDFKQQVDRLRAIEIPAPGLSTRDHSNESRTLTLTFTNGMLADVQVKQAWAQSQSGRALTMTLQSLLDEHALDA